MTDSADGAVTAPYFRGWNIVGFTFVMQFITMGLSYYAFSVYLKPLTEALGEDRFWISLTMSIQSVVVALLSPLAARLIADYSLRLVLFVGTVCLAGGFVALSQVTSLWQLYVLFGGVVPVGLVLLGMIPSNLLLANWFDRKRGTAMGISQFGITISATVLVPLVTWLIITYDWQTSFVICGVGALVLLAPLIWLFAIKTPEEVGLHPDGAPVATQVSQTADPRTGSEWTFFDAIKQLDIWLLTLVAGPCYMGIASVVLSLPAHATDLGLSALEASSIVAVTTFMGASAKIVFGVLADYINKKTAVAIAIVCQAVGVLILISVDTYVGLAIAGFFFGLGYGGIAPLWAILLATRFGRAAFATVMGASMPLLTPFNIVGLPVTSWIFETFGSYLPAFTVLLCGYAIALVALTLFRLQPRAPQGTLANP